ncbi:protein translocase subunit SecF [Anaerotignum propionicum]|uniref:Protein-export membrane protein SecF n=1 Tax=Anaerotignum propionicum DSM 1682 TaxID=991789 RepID=A0A120MK34_ANAPI|nr:protein translocase subunit SecF [Anaerotignum propionicum]AMJ40031.1 protein-export membrane protein SecF [Anaerotignum propionicum DSM 1682]SHE79074.1 protein-export membrane protein SecF [[Clostridium] propionicum DSM 1682] [Anaerotignum propionicum DSM 1682]
MKIVENRKRFFAISLVLILVGFVAMFYQGSKGNGILNWDVEFTGGTSMEIDMGEAYDHNKLNEVIFTVTGQKSPQIQDIIGTNEVGLKMQSIDSKMRTDLENAIKAAFPSADVKSTSDVSGTVSSEMQQAAIKATLIACVAMLIYISIRFRDIRAGGSAIIALLHDILIVIATYAIFRIPVNNSFIAVILTILGYSINATIVIFDRVRENHDRFSSHQNAEKINKSISQTLARSINTSVTTFFTVGAIYVIGVQSIKEFALPMMVGIIVGAYSSICISGSVWYTLLPKKEK